MTNVKIKLRITQYVTEENANKRCLNSIHIDLQCIIFISVDVIENIKAIRKEKGITQQVIADALNYDIANWNRVENGKQELKVNQLADIARVLDVRIIDIFTYPKKYIDKESIEDAERISVTFEISPDKRDYLLRLVTNEK